MLQDHLLNPSYHYRGTYFKAKKADVQDFTASRFDQMFFKEENTLISSANDFSNGLLNAMGLNHQRARDFYLEKVNPQDKLTVDSIASAQIDEIKDFGFSELGIRYNADFNAHTQQKLVQDGLLNASRQESIYTDPKLFFRDEYHGEMVGTEPRGQNLTPAQLKMDGSAAGRWTNFLSEDNYRDNSVESMVAF